MNNQFNVGVGREIITPKIGARLFGYKTDVYSKSVNDDLTVTAIALKCGKEDVILISATVCLINTSLCDEIRRKVSEATGVRQTNVILSTTHTHSGPCTEGNTGWGEIDREYCDEIFIPKTVSAVKQAVESLKPAIMGIGTVKSEIGINRRQIREDNQIILGQNPWGCYDPNLTVISFKETSGKPIANIVHYGAHCTAAGCNLEITRDWAGVMIDRLEEISGAVTAFFNGAEGDVGPRLTNGSTVGDIKYAMEHGGLAAHDAVKAYNSIEEYSEAGLSVVNGELLLPYDEVIPLKEAEKKLKECDEENLINIAGRMYYYYKSVVEAYKSGLPTDTHFKLEQTIVKVGPVVFVPIPFEFFSEISLRLRTYSPYPHTLCLGCTNGNYGYLPSQDQICRGGYEIEMFRTWGVKNLAKDTDNNIILENLRIMKGLV
jgi:neutral ceramidase